MTEPQKTIDHEGRDLAMRPLAANLQADCSLPLIAIPRRSWTATNPSTGNVVPEPKPPRRSLSPSPV